MKKNVIIAFLSIVSIASFVYGYSQKQRADQQEAIAIEQTNIARLKRLEAEHERAKIEVLNVESHKQLKLAQEALKESKK